ncbi:MAG TPA: DUF5615 family PIN-like protein [Chloroflexota bacterium]|nr:DUF5615 family PIN-like protein [Chloroflexota bacterium]
MTDVYLDADVAVALAVLLRAAGHEAVTADEEGLKYARDNVQMLAAWQRGRVLVTHNGKDFPDHYEAWQTWPPAWALAAPSHPGIVVLAQMGSDDLGAALIAFFAAGHPLADRLYRWRPSDGWSLWETGAGWRHFP